MDKLKKALSGDDNDEEQGIVTQINDATTLSWETRIKGFAVCFILGISLSILGSCLLWVPKNGLILFACFYTVGNIMSLARNHAGQLYKENLLDQIKIVQIHLSQVTMFLEAGYDMIFTCFLMGPVKQLKKMFAQTRIFATILVVVMLVLTLVCAIALKNPILTLMCCIVQFLALTWYSLSYIPFARDAVKKCFEGCIS